jgi:hypothetical protein
MDRDLFFRTSHLRFSSTDDVRKRVDDSDSTINLSSGYLYYQGIKREIKTYGGGGYVFYQVIKREINRRLICECRYDERFYFVYYQTIKRGK